MNTANEKLFLDPLTGLPNFFEFIETDIKKACKDRGFVIILDFARFTMINRTYGRQVGNLALKELTYVIRSVFAKLEYDHVFRTGGDEFIIILPQIDLVEGETYLNSIINLFKKSMDKHGYPNIELHSYSLEYKTPIETIDEFYYMLIYRVIEESDNPQVSRYNWVERMISNFTHRVKDTLGFYNEAFNLANTDDISGLPNQRAARSHFNSLISEYEGSKKEFGILFIDGDNLKRYNNISYEEGNKMIRKLAETISGILSEDARVFRWLSGDEFLVAADGANAEATSKIAEKIRIAVEDKARNWIYPVTISIGQVNYPEDGLLIDELIKKAEKANAHAKALGKNRVVLWRNVNTEQCG